MSEWRAVKSNKPRREGEAFVMRGDTFMLKVYKDVVPDTFAFAQYLARQLQMQEDKKNAASSS
jgi:hypothetical protein